MTDKQIAILRSVANGEDLDDFYGGLADEQHSRLVFRECLERNWLCQREWDIRITESGREALRNAIRERHQRQWEDAP